MIVKYCDAQIKDGTMSIDGVRSRIKNQFTWEIYIKASIDSIKSQNIDEHEFKDAIEVYKSKEDENNIICYNNWLSSVKLKFLSYNTVYQWLSKLGYKYNEHKNLYYNDGHEREDVVKDRDERFLYCYFKSEIKVHRWVQISEVTSRQLKDEYEDFPYNSSYIYEDTSGCSSITMHKYHIDSHECLSE